MKRISTQLRGSTKQDPLQTRLFIIASLIPLIYGAVLTIAPAIRLNGGIEDFQFQHWIGVAVWLLSFSVLNHLSAKKHPTHDPYLVPLMGVLSGIGLLCVWRLYPDFGIRQTIWLGLGCIVFNVGLIIPEYINYLRRYKYIFLGLGLILTIMTIFWGYNPIGAGPTLWLRIFGINIQPSEPLKLLLITFLAGFFSDQLTAVDKKMRGVYPTLILTGIAMLLLIFQRDLGTASIFLFIYLALIFTIQGNKIILWVTPIVLALAAGVGYFFIDIIRVRIDTWLSPFGDPTGTSYQIIQSLIGIAEGGIFGSGPGLGSPRLIPVSVSDFIFAAIAEELGLLGVCFIILLLILLIYRGTKIALSSPNSFQRYLALGITFYFGIQSILIIGGNLGLLPLTGVTLPFVSYGGSSLLVSFIAVLLLLTISTQSHSDVKLSNPPRFSVFSLIMIGILILEIVTASLIAFWFEPRLVVRAENPRPFIDDLFVERGDILDRNNLIIITNSGDVGSFQRFSKHIPLTPIIGYTNAVYGQTGIEDSMFSILRGYEGTSDGSRFWRELLNNQPPEGLDIRLTIDLDLQNIIDERIEDQVGSVLLMNAASGEILAAASHPYFDASNLEAQWDALIQNQNGPLLNRGMQALYPPGASLLPLLITDQISLLEITDDTSSIISTNTLDLNCALPLAEDINWQELISNGCLGVQKTLANITGEDGIRDLFTDFGLFSEPQLRLLIAESAQRNEDITYENLSQGIPPFEVTPLQIGIAASVLTNEGTLPSPRIVSAYKNPSGEWMTVPKLASNTEIFPAELVKRVTDLIKNPSMPIWQVTSRVDSKKNESIAWYVAGTTADWQGQPTILVISLENTSAATVTQIGEDLIDQVILSRQSIP